MAKDRSPTLTGLEKIIISWSIEWVLLQVWLHLGSQAMLLRFILLALLFSVQALFSDIIFPCGGRSSHWQSWVCILTFVTLRVPASPRLKLIGVMCPSLNHPYDTGWLGLGLRPTFRAWGWAQSDWRFWKTGGRHHNKRNGGWTRKTALTHYPPGLSLFQAMVYWTPLVS